MKNLSWKNIWDKKHINTNEYSHINDGFDGLSLVQWKSLVTIFNDLVGINKDSIILDVGCGSGAFLEQIKKYTSISGLDNSSSAIKNIRGKLDGNFLVSEGCNIPFNDNTFNKVISFSVFHYFPSLEYAKMVVREMVRVCRKNGSIMIGDINDIDKKDEYLMIRGREERSNNHIVQGDSPIHLFFNKNFFQQIAKQSNLKIYIIDENNLKLPYYSPSNYRYTVLYNK